MFESNLHLMFIHSLRLSPKQHRHKQLWRIPLLVVWECWDPICAVQLYSKLHSFVLFLQQKWKKCSASLLQAPQVRTMAVNKEQHKFYSMSQTSGPPPSGLPSPKCTCFIVFNHNNKAMHEYCLFIWIWMVAGRHHCKLFCCWVCTRWIPAPLSKT